MKIGILLALVLGLIQGLTEFLPVSSTGHLAIAQNVVAPDKDLPQAEKDAQKEKWLAFDVTLHLPTLLAVVVYFRRDVLSLIRGFLVLCLSISPARRPPPGSRGEDDRKLLIYVVLASIPTAVIALVIKELVKESLDNLVAIGVFLVITGVILFVTRGFSEEGRGFSAMRARDGLIIGIVQGLAAFPGISRSGSTISSGIFLGLDRNLAARFSFLISVPAILGASIFEFKHIRALGATDLWPAVAACVVAFVAAYVAITLVFRILEKRKFAWFAPYCWAAGIAAVLLGLFR